MDNLLKLIPKDKFDVSGIEQLKAINVEEIEPILWELLKWIQDINWPIARELIEILPRFHFQLIPYIKTVFDTDDSIWKCWVLWLIEKFPEETIKILASDIRRIAYNPTIGERNEETNLYALDVISKFEL